MSGIAHPVAAASLTAAWVVGRVAYTKAYTAGDPSKVSPTIRARSVAHITQRNTPVALIGALGHYSE